MNANNTTQHTENSMDMLAIMESLREAREAETKATFGAKADQPVYLTATWDHSPLHDNALD